MPGFFGSALEAYSIGSVPIQYFAAVGVCLSVLLLLVGKFGTQPGRALHLFAPFIVWAVAVTTIGTALDDYASKMPVLSTTSYGVYMFLRFLNLAAFAANVYLVGCVARGRGLSPVIARTAEFALLIAIVGLYLYYAPLMGLPEPPRGRTGTNGGAQSELSIYYDFHRAMGTFREPGIFAEWLMPMFCLSFLHSGARRIVCLAAIGTMLMLTGSLTGFFGLAGGTIIAAIIVYRGRAGMLKVILVAGVFIAIAVGMFTLLVRTYSGIATAQSSNISDMLTRRITPMLSEGVSGTDRAYIYNYVASAPAPVLGVGLGNAGLVLSESIGLNFPGSFLSLYLNTYYSLGPFGLALLAVFLLAPVVRAARCTFAERKQIFWLLAAYCAVLIAYGAAGDELSTISALSFAFLWFGVDAVQRVRRSQMPAARRLPKGIPGYRQYPASVGITTANAGCSSPQ